MAGNPSFTTYGQVHRFRMYTELSFIHGRWLVGWSLVGLFGCDPFFCENVLFRVKKIRAITNGVTSIEAEDKKSEGLQMRVRNDANS